MDMRDVILIPYRSRFGEKYKVFKLTPFIIYSNITLHLWQVSYDTELKSNHLSV